MSMLTYHTVYRKYFQTSQQSLINGHSFVVNIYLQMPFKIFLPACDTLWFHYEVSRCGFIFVYAAIPSRCTFFNFGNSSVKHCFTHILSIFVFWYFLRYILETLYTHIYIIYYDIIYANFINIWIFLWRRKVIL